MTAAAPIQTPFRATHRRRKDGLKAMFLGISQDGLVLYRIQFKQGRRLVDRATNASLAHFERNYA